MVIGMMIRLCLIDLVPGGLNQDESSIGYEAYSIMTYGIDRNGMRYPVHLIAWGSGQNALYDYYIIPFIKILGNNEIAIRLPMAISSCISLYLIYYTFDKLLNHKFALFSLLFIRIMPWHIMKSRFGLESNLFPEMLLHGTLLIMLSTKEKHHILFYLSSVIFGLSSYSYGTSYFFLFFFVIFILIYLYVKRYQKWFYCLIYLVIVFVICISIILFLYINLFDKETMHILWFDIPKLTIDRFHSVTSIFSSKFFSDALNNLSSSLALMISQNDGLPYNSTPYFGCLYLFTLPFTIIGLFIKPSIKNKNIYELKYINEESKNYSLYLSLNKIWLIVSLMMMCIISSNINRINVVWFPYAFLSIAGLYETLLKFKLSRKPLAILYLVSFVGFMSYYPFDYNDDSIKVLPYVNTEYCNAWQHF